MQRSQYRVSLLRERQGKRPQSGSLLTLIVSAYLIALFLYLIWLVVSDSAEILGGASFGDLVTRVMVPALLVVLPIATLGYGANWLADTRLRNISSRSEQFIRTGMWLVAGVVGSVVGIELISLLHRGILGLDSSLLAYTVTANIIVLLGVSLVGAFLSFRRRGRMLHRQTRLLTDEFRTAHDVQQGLLPQERPQLPGYDISGTMRPAVEVGGDYFDYLSFADGTKGVMVADASGKGIPAALIMAKFQGMVQALSIYAPSVREFFSALNDALRVRLDRGRFITAGLISIDLDDRCAFWRAGHNTLLHYRAATEDVLEYQPVGMGLGLTDGPVLESHLEPMRFEFETGDALLLSSDGLTETPDSEGEQYGARRLQYAFGESAGRYPTSSAIHDAIIADLEQFRGDAIEHDDITLVIVRKEEAR